MALNQPNPQRGTERRTGTGVRPAPAPPSASLGTGAAPAAQGGANRPTGRRPGAPPAPGGAARPPIRSASQQQGSGKAGKYILLTIIVLLIGMVAYGFIPRKSPDGTSKPGLFMALLNKYLPKAKADTSAEELPDLDRRYARALEWREKAKAYVDEQTAKFKEKPEALTEVERGRVADEIEKHRVQVESGTDDLVRVAAANGQGTKIDAATAKEEQKKQKAAAMELGKTLIRWRGAIDKIFAKSDEPEFVARKFDEKKPEAPAEKKEPRRGAGESVVAPLDPKDAPKVPPPPAEPDKPKEEPKPAEPKPEPEKPKPAEPKPEPEKPKPAEPKPEPEKPKPEPKPEPEKPKPAEPKPAEPKPEPEKPKEEPKPEPKPEKKIDVILAEADKLILDGTPMVKEILAASRNLPDDQEKLKTLSMKVETAQAFFIKARESYLGVKDSAPESANVPGTLTKIEKILDLLQKASDGIKSKMK